MYSPPNAFWNPCDNAKRFRHSESKNDGLRKFIVFHLRHIEWRDVRRARESISEGRWGQLICCFLVEWVATYIVIVATWWHDGWRTQLYYSRREFCSPKTLHCFTGTFQKAKRSVFLSNTLVSLWEYSFFIITPLLNSSGQTRVKTLCNEFKDRLHAWVFKRAIVVIMGCLAGCVRAASVSLQS